MLESVCGAGWRDWVFVSQATITALCAPAWRKNQSNRLPRQKSPVLRAENPDMNWPCQIPARKKKKFSIFIQSRGSWVPFPATLSLSKGDWSTEPPLQMGLPTLLDSLTEGRTHNLVHHHPAPCPSGVHTHLLPLSLPEHSQCNLTSALETPLPKAMCYQLHVTKTSPRHTCQKLQVCLPLEEC